MGKVKTRVLFLCTGNSCRSQMAEGLVGAFLGDRFEAHSAGMSPTGYVHPMAVQAMREIGADISRQRSKSIDEFRHQAFDLVITVCDDAAENCPVWLGHGARAHLAFPTRRKRAAVTEKSRKLSVTCATGCGRRCSTI